MRAQAAWLIVAAALTGGSTARAAPPPFRAGIYSSFFVHPETGDELGMELELHLGAAPYGFFILCEGACAPAMRVPITISDGKLRFEYREALVDGHGRPAPPAVMQFTAWPKRLGLSIKQDGDLSAAYLKPVLRPRALATPNARPPVVYAPDPQR